MARCPSPIKPSLDQYHFNGPTSSVKPGTKSHNSRSPISHASSIYLSIPISKPNCPVHQRRYSVLIRPCLRYPPKLHSLYGPPPETKPSRLDSPSTDAMQEACTTIYTAKTNKWNRGINHKEITAHKALLRSGANESPTHAHTSATAPRSANSYSPHDDHLPRPPFPATVTQVTHTSYLMYTHRAVPAAPTPSPRSEILSLQTNHLPMPQLRLLQPSLPQKPSYLQPDVKRRC